MAAPPEPTANSNQPHIKKKVGADLDDIETGVGDRLIAHHVPGAALIIVKDGKIIDVKCYGYRDFANQLVVTPATPFCIGSCTKAFTAMAAEIAVDNGVLSLNDNPRKYLPDFKLKDPDSTNRVTVKDFLGNVSGLDEKSFVLFKKRFVTQKSDQSTEKILHVISGVRPTAKPGQKYQYSDLGYCVAGWTVAAAEQTTFDKLLEDRIFRPLDMQDSRLMSLNPSSEEVRMYVLDRNAQPKPLEDSIAASYSPATGIVSSPRDMAKWLAMLTGGGVFDGKRIVSQRGFDELLTPLVETKPGDSFGLGWDVTKFGDERIINHTGSEPGYAASVTFMPDRRLGVVLLTNLGAPAQEVGTELPNWIISQLMTSDPSIFN